MIKDWIGIKYTPHGRNKEEGYNCYGLVIDYLKEQGITVYDNYFNEYQQNETLKLQREEKNCIIVITEKSKPSHIGVYVGNGYFLHTTENTGSRLEKLELWRYRVKGFYKVIN